MSLRSPINGERPNRRPSTSRRLNEIVACLAVAIMVAKSRRSASATGNGSSSLIGMMWSGIRRSSEIRRGHRPALSASNRTNGRGAAASEIAEVQIGCDAGWRLSSTLRCVIVTGSAAAGPSSSARCHSVRGSFGSSFSPASWAASGPLSRIRTTSSRSPDRSTPPGQSPGATPAKARSQRSTVGSGA